MSLLQQHRDQCRADVTGSAGDENSHRRLHPWWLETRLERRGCESVNRAARRDGQFEHARPSSLRPSPLRCSGDRRSSIAPGDGPHEPRRGRPVRATLSPSPDRLSTPFCASFSDRFIGSSTADLDYKVGMKLRKVGDVSCDDESNRQFQRMIFELAVISAGNRAAQSTSPDSPATFAAILKPAITSRIDLV